MLETALVSPEGVDEGVKSEGRDVKLQTFTLTRLCKTKNRSHSLKSQLPHINRSDRGIEGGGRRFGSGECLLSVEYGVGSLCSYGDWYSKKSP